MKSKSEQPHITTLFAKDIAISIYYNITTVQIHVLILNLTDLRHEHMVSNQNSIKNIQLLVLVLT